MNSRRQILKLLGLAPSAAVGATAQLSALITSPAVATLGAVALPQTDGLAAPSYGRLGEIIGKQVSRLRDAANDEINAVRSVRAGGLDADIECLRSVSRVNKMRKQIERDLEEFSILRQANQAMWG